uniref:Potassium channel domain-containing protein n=1 Tax=Panagrolaimus superbus TaxID=310955 RepID=A0A914Z6S0_9BILA
MELSLKSSKPYEMTPEMLRIRDDWVAKVATHLQKFNENLYKAYKEEYVRYGDVRMTPREQFRDPRLKRHRSSKSSTEKGGKMWTWSSALFFAATTMATIGYGNIVPVTVSGKIACVIFALIGAPLAIITIGDLGKFLSECTIWFYTKMKDHKKRIKHNWKLYRLRKAGVMVDFVEESETPDENDPKTWEEELEKEVPVLLVFVILLLYIAFGGVLFAVLESWSYIDAFYYSFVSLTTIGFGDLVPDRHEYIVIMLIYLGVGLAVTTMCIDLVGIQYIQKIHYFGRKFQNTDLLQLLKRKRLIERRLALGQGEDIIHIIQRMAEEDQRQREPLPPPRILPPLRSAAQNWVNQTEEKYSLRSDSTLITPWNLSEVVVDEDEFPLFEAEKISPPTLISGPSSQRSSTISTTLTNSSASARSLMYRNWLNNRRGGSSIESGPDISFHCSLSTSPSVTAREFMYANFHSPDPSIQSFKFSFPLPSPDLRSIANAARSARRIRSAPTSLPVSPSDEFSPTSFPSTSVRRQTSFRLPYASSNVQYASSPVFSLPLTNRCSTNINNAMLEIPPPFMLSKLAAQCDDLEAFGSEAPIRFQESPRPHITPINKMTLYESPRDSVNRLEPPNIQRHIPKLNLSTPQTKRTQFFSRPLWYYRYNERRPHMLAPNFGGDEAGAGGLPPVQPVLKRKKLERIAKTKDPLRKMDWLNVSPRSSQIMDVVKNDLATLFEQVRRTSAATSNASSVVLVSPRNTIGLACMEEWDSYIQMVEESEKPRDPFVIPEEPSPIPSPPISSPSPSPPPKPLSPQKLPSPSPPPPPPPKLPTPLPSPSPPQILSPPKIPTPPKSPTPPPPPLKSLSPIPQPISPPQMVSPPVASPPVVSTPPPPRVPSPVVIPIHSILPSKDLPSIPFIPILPPLPPEPEPVPLSQQIIPEVAVELDIEPMYVESISVPMPMSSMADLLEVMIPEETEDDIISPMFPESSSGSDTLSPLFDIDLGAFELVDSGVTAEALLSHDDPVIYHKDMPVHSVHHDTVQTEAALENLMNAPSSMMSESVPPAMVCDNYCFVVDGDKVRMGDIMGDDQWWRHTSRPTKYFYSDDMKKFYRVNVISAKGKIITARLAAGSTSPNASMTVPHSQSHQNPPSSTSAMVSTALTMPSTSRSASLLSTHPAAASYPGTTIHSAATTPRASMCVGSTKGHRGEIVPLPNVYKVIRVYSFWKTCTSFHRIVTMIDTVTPDDKNANSEFNKRLFVQYLWRNAKPYEKARVQKEFDPRRQRLLRFVGDTEGKKKAMKPSASTSSATPSSASPWRRQPGGGSAPPTSSGRPTSRSSIASEGRLRTQKSRTSSTSSRGKKSPR